MAEDEVLCRLQRIYASLGLTIERDISQFPPKVVVTETSYELLQDFLGELSEMDLKVLAFTVIQNTANLRDHLLGWAKKHGGDRTAIKHLVKTSLPVQIIIDLSDSDKHGYPPRDGGYTGRSPKLLNVRRVLQLETATQLGSCVRIEFTPKGPKQKAGSGSASVVITATVVDCKGALMGDLYSLELEALGVWEDECRRQGIVLE